MRGCRTIATGPGIFAIACGTATRILRCKVPNCGRKGEKLCDHPVGRAGTTCDMPLCPAHAKSIGPDKDLCPAHATHGANV